MRKYPLLVKLNAAFHREYLSQLLQLWGVKEAAVPARAALVLTECQEFLKNGGYSDSKLKAYFFAAGSKLYLLCASPPEETKNAAWRDTKVKGLSALKQKLGSSAKSWEPFAFTDPEHISDPIAKKHAKALADPAQRESTHRFEILTPFNM